MNGIRTYFRWLKWYAVKVAILLCVFRFLCDMNWWASAVLSFLFIEALSRQGSSSSSTFTPFTFTLRPHIAGMLTDLGYIDEAALKELEPDRSNVWSGAHLEAFGLTGYALREGASGWPIVHWPGINFYTDGIGFHRHLEFLRPGDQFPSNVPACFCRVGRNAGLAFGISVKEAWWKANSDAIMARGIVLNADPRYQFGTVDLTMALLPLQAVIQFSGPQVISDYAIHEKQTKALAEALQKDGWMDESREGDESWMQSPTNYEHRYVTVSMNHLHYPQ